MVPYDRRHWLPSIFSIYGSVTPAVIPRVVLVTLAAAGATWLRLHDVKIVLPLAVPALVGTLLGLLLAFRTNTGYERFWEGRKAWGAIVNRTRNLGRQGATSFDDRYTQERICHLAIIFAHAARRELRFEKKFPELDEFLDEKTAVRLKTAPGPAIGALEEVGAELHRGRLRGRLDSVDQARLEADATALIDALGVCQRIRNTPIPFAYAIFLRRFLLLYCISLGFALAEPLGWECPIAVAVISYFLFGIEQIGVEIENPFEDLPNNLDLDGICKTIQGDVLAMLPPLEDK